MEIKEKRTGLCSKVQSRADGLCVLDDKYCVICRRLEAFQDELCTPSCRISADHTFRKRLCRGKIPRDLEHSTERLVER